MRTVSRLHRLAWIGLVLPIPIATPRGASGQICIDRITALQAIKPILSRIDLTFIQAGVAVRGPSKQLVAVGERIDSLASEVDSLGTRGCPRPTVRALEELGRNLIRLRALVEAAASPLVDTVRIVHQEERVAAPQFVAGTCGDTAKVTLINVAAAYTACVLRIALLHMDTLSAWTGRVLSDSVANSEARLIAQLGVAVHLNHIEITSAQVSWLNSENEGTRRRIESRIDMLPSGRRWSVSAFENRMYGVGFNLRPRVGPSRPLIVRGGVLWSYPGDDTVILDLGAGLVKDGVAVVPGFAIGADRKVSLSVAFLWLRTNIGWGFNVVADRGVGVSWNIGF